MKNLYVYFLTLAIILGSPSLTFACLDLPTDPPPVEITCLSDSLLKVRLKGYTTYGATTTDYCACALNVPATYGNVISATIVETCTDNAINGWSFTPNPNTQFSTPANWQGLSSAVSTAIGSGIPVDICFIVKIRTGDKQNPCGETAEDLANFFESADVTVGSGGADVNGKPDHHISQMPAGPVSVIGKETIGLFGVNYQNLGAASINYAGAEICINVQNQDGNGGIRVDYGEIDYGILRFGKPELIGSGTRSITAFGNLDGIPSSFLAQVNTIYDGTKSTVGVKYADAIVDWVFLELKSNGQTLTKVQVDDNNTITIEGGGIEIAEIDPVWDMIASTITIVKLPDVAKMQLPNGDIIEADEIVYSTKFEKQIKYVSHIDVEAKGYKKLVLKLGDMEKCN